MSEAEAKQPTQADYYETPIFEVLLSKLKVRIRYQSFDESIDLAALQCAIIDGAAAALRKCDKEGRKFTTTDEYAAITSELLQEFSIPPMDVAFLMLLNDMVQESFSELKKSCVATSSSRT